MTSIFFVFLYSALKQMMVDMINSTFLNSNWNVFPVDQPVLFIDLSAIMKIKIVPRTLVVQLVKCMDGQ